MTMTTNGSGPPKALVAAPVDSAIDADTTELTRPGAEGAVERRRGLPLARRTRPGAVARLREQLDTARELVELQDDEALTEALTVRERRADRRVAESLRAAARRERKRAGLEQLRGARRARTDERWSRRAVRARERLLNANRRLATSYRRYVILSAITIALMAAGVAWMSVTVHHGLVGVDGTWIAYLVEPLASLLLVVSMFAQFTAVAHGLANPRWFLALDGAVALASLLLNIVPWALRFGFTWGELLAHALPPLLVAAAVVVNHMLNSLFGKIFEDLHLQLDDTLRLTDDAADVVLLVERTRRAIDKGEIDVDGNGFPVTEQIRKRFGIAKPRAQATSDAFKLLAGLG